MKEEKYINFIKNGHPLRNDGNRHPMEQTMDPIIEFIESNFELASDFLGCHMNPWALYALCKLRIKKNNRKLQYEDVLKYYSTKLPDNITEDVAV